MKIDGKYWGILKEAVETYIDEYYKEPPLPNDFQECLERNQIDQILDKIRLSYEKPAFEIHDGHVCYLESILYHAKQYVLCKHIGDEVYEKTYNDLYEECRAYQRTR